MGSKHEPVGQTLPPRCQRSSRDSVFRFSFPAQSWRRQNQTSSTWCRFSTVTTSSRPPGHLTTYSVQWNRPQKIQHHVFPDAGGDRHPQRVNETLTKTYPQYMDNINILYFLKRQPRWANHSYVSNLVRAAPRSVLPLRARRALRASYARWVYSADTACSLSRMFDRAHSTAKTPILVSVQCASSLTDSYK